MSDWIDWRGFALGALIGVSGVVVAGCGGSSTSPPPSPPPPAVATFPITIPGAAGWAVTQSSSPRPLVNGKFDFLRCPSVTQCHDSYVQVSYGVSLGGAKSVTLDYEIDGENPVFLNDSPGNTCRGDPALSLLLERSGDAALLLANPTYRQWSFDTRQTLAVGKNTYTVPIDVSRWINVNGQHDFGDTLANIGNLGFSLGGGCFAGHGVAVQTGSAQLTIHSLTVK